MNIEVILQYILYFFIYSFAGWVLESVSKTIAQKKLVNSGFLKGPYCPIYGFGALIMILCLGFLKQKPILLFIAGFFILSIWEYVVGVLLEKIFKTKYWDYSHLKFNIKGRVCLKNSIFWGVLGLVFVRYVHEWVKGYVILIPKDTLFYIDVILGIAIIIDIIVSVIEVTNFEISLEKINKIGESIKEKLEEIKILNGKTKEKTLNAEKDKTDNIEKVINELKLAQDKLKLKIYKQASRLKKAFPSMKSESITKILSEKMDLKKLKENIKIKSKNKE